MDITNAQRARVLVHALPYIQDYSGKIVVVKYGGNAMISEHLKDSVIRDICLLQLIGVKVVLVHGGGPEITEGLARIVIADRGHDRDIALVEHVQNGLDVHVNCRSLFPAASFRAA